MKKLNKNLIVTTVLTVALVLGITGSTGAGAAAPAPVDLLSAGNFVILSKTGITNTGSHTSTITGNIGSSPITAAAMDDVFCSEITGTIYGVDAAYTGSGDVTCFAGNPGVPAVVPTDANKILVDNAVLDMGTAYTNAAGRTSPNTTELGAGDISGLTIAPGLHKWSTDVDINTDVTLSGGANDVWIFQIAGDLRIASGGSVPAGIKIVLAGGAQASNVFWQVGASNFGATLGTYSTFNGNILSAKQVIIQTGAVLNGRALADSQVTLDANIITAPASTPVDTVAPVIVVHADVSASGAVVTYTSPATSDAVDGAGVATCLPASGSTFPIGNTTVTCNATDVAGNQALATTFTVTVIGTPAPAPVVSVSPGGGTAAFIPSNAPNATPVEQVSGITTPAPSVPSEPQVLGATTELPRTGTSPTAILLFVLAAFVLAALAVLDRKYKLA